jgi:outer membrane biosynthesis protein TonB
MLLSHEAGGPAAGGDIEMVGVPNPMARHRDLLDDGDTGGGKTLRTNETVKRLQTEVGLLNVKLAQQESEMAQQQQQLEQRMEQRVEQQRQQMEQQRQQMEQRVEQQRQQMEQQRQQIDRLMAIVESATFSTVVSAVKNETLYLPEGWTALKTEEGKTYYKKPDGSTTWDRP